MELHSSSLSTDSLNSHNTEFHHNSSPMECSHNNSNLQFRHSSSTAYPNNSSIAHLNSNMDYRNSNQCKFRHHFKRALRPLCILRRLKCCTLTLRPMSMNLI
eukprot:NODE_442_length_8548_cov_0.231862.p7 type:complete len:102 gc:universal NODE_442_length_8548_cov_0.231862:824-1129(+)